jgi:biopolymer transport protein ExbB/TolQ
MWVNLFVLVVALAVVSERLFVLQMRLRINDSAFLQAVEKLVMAGNFERAIKLCTAQEGAAVPRVVRSALVYGLIESFDAIGNAAPDQKSILLTQGIAHAMSNTFFGLAIAVTCVFFHMILTVVTKNILDSLEHSAVRIENILAKRRAAVGGREVASPPTQA